MHAAMIDQKFIETKDDRVGKLKKLLHQITALKILPVMFKITLIICIDIMHERNKKVNRTACIRFNFPLTGNASRDTVIQCIGAKLEMQRKCGEVCEAKKLLVDEKVNLYAWLQAVSRHREPQFKNKNALIGVFPVPLARLYPQSKHPTEGKARERFKPNNHVPGSSHHLDSLPPERFG